MKTYGFDLAAFLAGEVTSSPKLVLTMIRHLPEGTNYVSILRSAPAEGLETKEEEEPEIDLYQEHLTWTQDRLLMAQLINSVNMLVRHSVNWQEGKAPTMPLVGPASWRGEGKSTGSKPQTVADVLNSLMGHM